MKTIYEFDLIDKINKYEWGHRLVCLCDILDKIEWATEREGKEMDSEIKELLTSYLKRKLEWIESMS